MNISGNNCKFALGTLLVGLAGACAIAYVGVPNIEVGDLRQIASTVAQIAATMMGFLLAALAILASIANMRLLRNMQRTGHYQVLLGRMLITAAYFFFAMVFSILVLVAPGCLPKPIEVGSGFLIGSCYALIRSTLNFSSVLFSLKPDSNRLED
jgi:hypothetical protein